MLLPFVWMLVTSIKPPAEIFARAASQPASFLRCREPPGCFRQGRSVALLLNGVIVCGGIFGLQLLVAIPCAYALAKLRFPGRDALFALVVLCS